MANEIKNAMMKATESASQSQAASKQVDDLLGSQTINDNVVEVKDIQILGAAIKLQNGIIAEISNRLLEIEDFLAQMLTQAEAPAEPETPVVPEVPAETVSTEEA